MKRAALLCLCWLCLFLPACGGGKSAPLYLGILLPLSDENNPGWENTLDWIKQNINDQGGVAGHSLEYIIYDTAGGQTAAQVNRLLSENRVVAVVGPDNSADAFATAPKFIKAKIPMFTIASSATLFKAYKGSGYVWRTVESDVAQVQTMLLLAKREKFQRVALLVNDNEYGATFFDWFGFFATELGLEVGGIVKVMMREDECSSYCEQAVENDPDVLFVVPSNAKEGVCIARFLRTRHPEIKLFFSDTGVAPYYLSELGELAEGLEGVTYSYNSKSGFAFDYQLKFGGDPPALSANIYDSIMLLAFALELSGGAGGETLSSALKKVVDGRGEKTGWDSYEIGRTLKLIHQGESPDINGATGGLEFDRVDYTDPLVTVYEHLQVQAGKYVTIEYFFSGQDPSFNRSDSMEAAYKTFASEEKLQRFASGVTGTQVKERAGVYALVVSTSDTWANYRHQADALAQYDLLRRNGIPDDRIILILADDLAQNILNPEPGTVRNEPGGDNLYQAPVIDYRVGDLDARALLNILGGVATPERPTVLNSTDTDNVYVFIVGHGGSDGVCLKECAEYLSPSDLQATIGQMAAAGRFRRMLVVVEACHGGVMGAGLTAPGAILLAGANPIENSLASNYDQELDAWVSNEFAFAYYSAVSNQPDLPLFDLYRGVYLKVPGSHVTVYNAENFGDLAEIGIEEFISY